MTTWGYDRAFKDALFTLHFVVQEQEPRAAELRDGAYAVMELSRLLKHESAARRERILVELLGIQHHLLMAATMRGTDRKRAMDMARIGVRFLMKEYGA